MARLQGNYRAGEEGEFSNEERNSVFFQHERIYKHAVMRVNYTTYDVRREQDYLNPRTSKRDIMVNSNEDTPTGAVSHPFWYARVLGIFHAQVQVRGPDGLSAPQHMEFLWVRWLGLDDSFTGGWSTRRLDRIGFVEHTDAEAFGFLDPSCVLRATHLVPAFAHGRTPDLCPPSLARDDEGDWEYFYVNR